MKTVVGVEYCLRTSSSRKLWNIVCAGQRRQKKVPSHKKLPRAAPSHSKPLSNHFSKKKASHYPRIVIGQGPRQSRARRSRISYIKIWRIAQKWKKERWSHRCLRRHGRFRGGCGCLAIGAGDGPRWRRDPCRTCLNIHETRWRKLRFLPHGSTESGDSVGRITRDSLVRHAMSLSQSQRSLKMPTESYWRRWQGNVPQWQKLKGRWATSGWRWRCM